MKQHFFFPIGILIAAETHSVFINLHPCKQIGSWLLLELEALVTKMKC